MIIQILQTRGISIPQQAQTQTQTAQKFTQTLKYGQENDEVKALQVCLAKDSDVYPEGITSGWFGSLTRNAINRFQEKYASEILTPYGLTEGTGIVGAKTREKLNEICK